MNKIALVMIFSFFSGVAFAEQESINLQTAFGYYQQNKISKRAFINIVKSQPEETKCAQVHELLGNINQSGEKKYSMLSIDLAFICAVDAVADGFRKSPYLNGEKVHVNFNSKTADFSPEEFQRSISESQ